MDRFVLYTFCHDYHSGQGSRGYRILSRLGAVNISSACMAECRTDPLYDYLVESYANTV